MRPARRHALAAMVTWLVGSSQVAAYVRTRNPNGTPVAWVRSCVFLLAAPGTCPDVPEEAVWQAIQSSVRAWNDAAASCNASIVFELDETDEVPEPGFDPEGPNENVIVWLRDHWGSGEIDYDPAAVALTTLTYVTDPDADNDGEILDADIELNGVYQRFQTDGNWKPGAYDVANTLTHELGHVLGLDHTCYDGSLPDRPVDDQGNPIPDCIPASKLPEDVRTATMYPFAAPGETDKRTLESDDIRGVCEIYPPDREAGPCAPVDLSRGCRCATSASQGGLGLWLAVLALVALLRRRQRPARQVRSARSTTRY